MRAGPECVSHWENEGTVWYLKDRSEVFWDETTRRGDRQLPPSGAKCPRRRCVPTIDEVEQKTKLAASLTTQHKLSLPLISC